MLYFSYVFRCSAMSRKGYSPGNAAGEGFFGEIKNEMFYGRWWMGVSLRSFMDMLVAYLKWHNEKHIKISFSGLSPLEYRRSLELIA